MAHGGLLLARRRIVTPCAADTPGAAACVLITEDAIQLPAQYIYDHITAAISCVRATSAVLWALLCSTLAECMAMPCHAGAPVAADCVHVTQGTSHLVVTCEYGWFFAVTSRTLAVHAVWWVILCCRGRDCTWDTPAPLTYQCLTHGCTHLGYTFEYSKV